MIITPTDVIKDVAAKLEAEALKHRQQLDLTLRRAAIAFRAVYEAAHDGNVTCRNAVTAMEKEK